MNEMLGIASLLSLSLSMCVCMLRPLTHKYKTRMAIFENGMWLNMPDCQCRRKESYITLTPYDKPSVPHMGTFHQGYPKEQEDDSVACSAVTNVNQLPFSAARWQYVDMLYNFYSVKITKWRHDTQNIDTRHNDTQLKELICDTQHACMTFGINDTKHK